LIVRPATKDDDLVAIWREVYEADHVPLLPQGVHAPFEPQGDAYVAEMGGAAIGFSYVDGDWLDELWVGKAWQGRGIGTKLIGHAEEVMRGKGVTEASLSVMRANVRTVSLYRRLGWSELRQFVSKSNGQTYLRLIKNL
jgi:ribosomal protein S18 acetylase RimI-like enzyme